MAPKNVPLTWRNVSAPSGSALSAFNQSAQLIGNSIAGLGANISEGAQNYADYETAEFLTQLNAERDPAKRQAMIDASNAFLDPVKVQAAQADNLKSDQAQTLFDQKIEEYNYDKSQQPILEKRAAAQATRAEEAHDANMVDKYNKAVLERDKENMIRRMTGQAPLPPIDPATYGQAANPSSSSATTTTPTMSMPNSTGYSDFSFIPNNDARKGLFIAQQDARLRQQVRNTAAQLIEANGEFQSLSPNKQREIYLALESSLPSNMPANDRKAMALNLLVSEGVDPSLISSAKVAEAATQDQTVQLFSSNVANGSVDPLNVSQQNSGIKDAKVFNDIVNPLRVRAIQDDITSQMLNASNKYAEINNLTGERTVTEKGINFINDKYAEYSTRFKDIPAAEWTLMKENISNMFGLKNQQAEVKSTAALVEAEAKEEKNYRNDIFKEHGKLVSEYTPAKVTKALDGVSQTKVTDLMSAAKKAGIWDRDLGVNAGKLDWLFLKMIQENGSVDTDAASRNEIEINNTNLFADQDEEETVNNLISLVQAEVRRIDLSTKFTTKNGKEVRHSSNLVRLPTSTKEDK